MVKKIFSTILFFGCFQVTIFCNNHDAWNGSAYHDNSAPQYATALETLKEETVKLYDETAQTLFQLMNGDHFLSQGGTERVDLMVHNIDLTNKTVLDVGSGLGGPAVHLADKHKALVMGIDIDVDLVAKATAYARHTQVSEKINFVVHDVEQPLAFNKNNFDIVFSKESIVHVKSKLSLFTEFHRVLKPDGTLVIMDWFWKDQKPSQDLLACMRLDGWGKASGQPHLTYSIKKHFFEIC